MTHLVHLAQPGREHQLAWLSGPDLSSTLSRSLVSGPLHVASSGLMPKEPWGEDS